jgi:hypothetical protein
MSSNFMMKQAKLMKEGNFKDIIPLVLSENPGPLNLRGFNSVISGLANLTLEDGFSRDNIFDVIDMVQTKEKPTETTYTALIKLYCSDVCYDMININELLSNMKSVGFNVKRRTMAPIFDMCLRESLPFESMRFYLDSKVLGITLEAIDYINLLTIFQTHSDTFTTKTILNDFSSNINTINRDELEMLTVTYILHSQIGVNENGIISPNNDDEDTDIPNYQIPAFELSASERKSINDSFILFVNKFYGKNSKNFTKFVKWINQTEYNLVIDGANIGYYQQGVNSGKILDYNQIEKMVNKAISNGYKPLLILHSRHNNGNPVLNKITRLCSHYFTPKGMDDDIFWLYASLMKRGCRILTNDELRNHLFYMNLGEKFIEWKKYNRVTYNINNGNIVFTNPRNYMEKIHYQYSTGNIYIPVIDKNGIISEWYYFPTL